MNRVHSAASGSIPVEGGAQLFSFSRRSSSASTASRMNFARPYVPQSASMRSSTSGGNLTCVGLFPSGGRPMRGAVVDTDKSDKAMKNDTDYVDGINDVVYIIGIENGGNPMFSQVTAQQGSRHVVTSANTDQGPFESRLYVNRGNTATQVSAKHKSLNGAAKWAQKVVSQ